MPDCSGGRPNKVDYRRVTCPTCNGLGCEPNWGNKCEKCNGFGTFIEAVPRDESVSKKA